GRIGRWPHLRTDRDLPRTDPAGSDLPPRRRMAGPPQKADGGDGRGGVSARSRSAGGERGGVATASRSDPTLIRRLHLPSCAPPTPAAHPTRSSAPALRYPSALESTRTPAPRSRLELSTPPVGSHRLDPCPSRR